MGEPKPDRCGSFTSAGWSDSTVARTCRATGEALLVPARNRRSRIDRITGSTGKSIEGERVTDGFVVCAGQRVSQGGRNPLGARMRSAGSESGACDRSHGFDASKKIKGKKRHILVDTQGLLMHAIVHAADVQDRDGGALLMASLFGAFPFLIKLYADGGYQGREFPSAMQRILARVNVEIVKRSGQAAGFVALPKRWIVERTSAWLGRCRRLAKDWECLNHKALAFLRLASIRFMLRKLCNPT
jgi:transposase